MRTCCERVLARVLAVVDKKPGPFLPRSVVASKDDRGALRHGASQGTQPSCAQLLLLMPLLLPLCASITWALWPLRLPRHPGSNK
jgi:hypothetical protein